MPGDGKGAAPALPCRMAAVMPRSRSPSATWVHEHGRWTLRLDGAWDGGGPALPEPPQALAGAPVHLDGRGLVAWTPALAAALWTLLARLARPADLGLLPAGLRQVLALALASPAARAAEQRRSGLSLHAIGRQAAASWEAARTTLGFVGEVLLAGARLLRGRSAMRAADLAWQIDRTGPRSVPIVALVCGLVGLILAYMGAAQLQRFGAQGFIADLVTIGVVREVAALMTGLILAGRVGAAFAAQLGSMQANDEVDALKTLGVDPVEHLVLPRVLAMAFVAPLLTALAAAVAVAAGALVAVAIFGVAPYDFGFRALQSLTPAHLAVGLFKGTVYAVLVALAGCRQGLASGRSAQAVGQATTAAVVQAIVWIVVAASALTIVFQRLGW